MTATTTAPTTTPDELADRLFASAVATLEVGAVHLGLELGLYEQLAAGGPATPGALARRTGVDERYAREWLEQQAVAQLLVCADPSRAPDERVYELPTATAEVLLDPASPAFLGPLCTASVGVMAPLRELVDAYQTGAGVPFGRFGAELRDGLGALNGATFDRELAGWIAALPDVHERLRSGPEPLVLDVGCGVGRSTRALARAYPRATVRGIDLDAASIEAARAATATDGLAHRVTFAVADAGSLDAEERFDLVTIFEALHDMGDPVGALAAARGLLRDGGAVLVADERTADVFTPDGDPIERFAYGCSVLHCLPATRAEEHVTAHGTVLRSSTVRAWAREAGFDGAEVLDIHDDFWRFYRL